MTGNEMLRIIRNSWAPSLPAQRKAFKAKLPDRCQQLEPLRKDTLPPGEIIGASIRLPGETDSRIVIIFHNTRFNHPDYPKLKELIEYAEPNARDHLTQLSNTIPQNRITYADVQYSYLGFCDRRGSIQIGKKSYKPSQIEGVPQSLIALEEEAKNIVGFQPIINHDDLIHGLILEMII